MSQPNIRQYQTTLKLTCKMLDVAAIGIGLWLLLQWFPELNSQATVAICLVAIGIFGVFSEFVGLYRSWQGIRFEREAACCMLAWGLTVMGLFALGSVSVYTTELSRHSLLLWFAFTPVISLSGRILCRWFMSYMVQRGMFTRSFAIVGINELAVNLVRNVAGSPDLGLKFLGFYDDRPEERTTELPAELENRLGRISDLVEHARRHQVSVVFITLPMRAEDRIRDVITRLSDSTVSVYVVPDLFVFQLMHSRWSDIQGVPVVSVFENPFYGVDGILKRSCDVVLSLAALAVAALPMALIAAAVKFTSRGPILFRQRRYGLDGREIRVLKFRTMTVCEDGDTVIQATHDDKRVTPLGAFLRRTSLDELPQLLNVLGGSMSMIGPRPHATAHNEFYRNQIEGYMLRHKVKPGITGLAQVNGCRGETETVDKMARRIQFDHQYIREWTIWLDFSILWRTVGIVAQRQNAY